MRRWGMAVVRCGMALVGLGLLACDEGAQAGQPLSALALKDLVNGSTIELGTGQEKVYLSLSLTNTLRRNALLGPDFLKKHVRKDLLAEAGFVGVFEIAGKMTPITGVGGIGEDKESGSGLVFLVQTFPDDGTVSKFAAKDRLYSVLLVSETQDGFACKSSRWEKMFAFKGSLTFSERPCRLVDGNFWLREGKDGVGERDRR